MKKIIFSLLIISLFLILSNLVVAEPLIVEMQGVIKDMDGTLYEDGNAIKVYKDGFLIGESESINNGYFNLFLGSTSVLEATCGDAITVNVKLGTEEIGDVTFNACATDANNLYLSGGLQVDGPTRLSMDVKVLDMNNLGSGEHTLNCDTDRMAISCGFKDEDTGSSAEDVLVCRLNDEEPYPTGCLFYRDTDSNVDDFTAYCYCI